MVRKPRSIARIAIAVFCFWIFPFLTPLSLLYVKAKRMKERQLRLSELKIGVKKGEVREHIGPTMFGETKFNEELGRNVEVWEYRMKKGMYFLFFDGGTLLEIEFQQNSRSN